MNTCVNCEFWVAIPEPEGSIPHRGRCQRYPPTVVYNNSQWPADMVWPMTSDTDWCGEFEVDPVLTQVFISSPMVQYEGLK